MWPATSKTHGARSSPSATRSRAAPPRPPRPGERRPVYTELDDLLADPAIDAVEILTPTNLHHDHVLAALAAGKHVSCQKPFANSVDEARAMAAGRRGGRPHPPGQRVLPPLSRLWSRPSV